MRDGTIINRLLRYFAGSVRFEVKSGFGERLLNLCAANNVTIWGLANKGEGFCACVSSKNYKKALELAGKANVEITPVYKKGFWFKANKYKSRLGIILGVIFFFVFLIVMQNVVWQIEVLGNQNVKTEVILSELADIGVHKFALVTGMDFREKKQQAMLNMPQLSWLAINKSGCKLTVHVTERRMKPEIEGKTPCDIVASKTGLILYMEVYSGRKVAYEKHTVQKGEKIVSGVVNSPEEYSKDLGEVHRGKTVYVHSDARVIAQVQHQKSLSVDIAQLSKSYTGEEKTRRYLTVFSLKLPLFLASDLKGLYDVSAVSEPFNLFGNPLPFGLCTMRYKFYEEKSQSLSREDARNVLLKSFEQYKATELRNSVVVSQKPKEEYIDGILTITMDYVLEQDIAKKVDIAE